MSEQSWYREFFGAEYFRLYANSRTPERTAGEVDGIVNLLNLPPGSRILDLCCGHGRIAIPLAQRGYLLTGQDLSEVFLERARADAAAAGVAIDWVHSDMRAIPFEATFDAVINIFTSFAYLESEEDDLKVLLQVRKALKPGGRFLLEMIHRESLLRRFRPADIQRLEDGAIVLHERSFDLLTSLDENRVTVINPDGTRWESRYLVRMYTVTELARLFAAAGIPVEACYGGLDGSELTLETRRVAVVGRKEAVSRG